MIPLSSLLICFASLLVPVLGAVYFQEGAQQYPLFLWLLALVPSFILAYHRGWKGVATALVGGMSLLSLTQAGLQVVGRTDLDWRLLLAVVTLFIAISLGIGVVSEMLHRERERAEKLALTDELTALPNRRYLRLFLETEFAAAQRGRGLVVCMFDIDAFKSFNDRWGHAAGDDALLVFAGALTQTTRRMNLSGRWGGEEFLCIVSGSDVQGALVFVDRVRARLAASAGALAAPLTVSAGLAAFEPSMKSFEILVDAADQALYEAKAAGRNAIRVHGSTTRAAMAVASGE